MKQLSLLLICMSPCVAQQAQLGFSGAVSGTLVGDDGTPVAGGYLGLTRLPPYPPGRLRQTHRTAVSRAGGMFLFEGLSEGRYRLCVQVPKSAWLNPCEWGLQPPIMSLSVAQPAVSVSVVLKKGAVLPIRINDVDRFLPQNEGKRPGAHLLLGVPTDALTFHPAALVSQDSNGRNHQVVVPFNTPVKLVVYSSFFRLGDAAGAPLAKSAVHVPVFVQSGMTPSAITLRVLGGSTP